MSTSQAQAFFAEHGWVVLRQVLGEAQIAQLASACDAIFPPTLAASLPHGEGIPHLVEPSRRHPTLRTWLREVTPFATAAACLGTERVQLLQDDLLVKRARADDTLAWHQDASYLGVLEPLRSVSIRLALDPETEESGCMWVIGGSHRWGLLAPDRSGAARVEDALGQAPPHARDAAIPIALEPGDVTIHDALTFHASYANRSDRPRRTLVTRVVARECRFVLTRVTPGLAPQHPTTPDGHPDPRRFPFLPLS